MASYKSISSSIIQLDSSPSQRRRRYNTYNQYSNSIRTLDSNTNLNNNNNHHRNTSTNDESTFNKSASLSSRHSSPYLSSKDVSFKHYNTIGSINEYDKKVSIDTMNDHQFMNSKQINNNNNNNNNYTSFSDIGNSDYNLAMNESFKPGERPCDRYGFFLESDDEYDSKTPTTQELKDIRQREKKWLQMLHNWKYYIDFKWDKIRDRCRKGIPHSLRSQAWFYLCGAHIKKRRHPRLYQDLQSIDIAEDVRSDILKDLDRQFPNHELFQEPSGTGQADLYNVLKAFAAYKKDIGYCQAQGPIAAVLLMHMPAENAFWSLVALNDYYVGDYFRPNLEKVQIHGQMLFAFLKRFSPNSYKLLKQQNIDPVLYMTEWFMCIYSRNLPWSSVLRVWDMFLCEGVIILIKVGIYLVDVSLRTENPKTCPSMFETCTKLRNIPKHFLSEHSLMKGISRINLSDSDFWKEHKVQQKKYRKRKLKESARNGHRD